MTNQILKGAYSLTSQIIQIEPGTNFERRSELDNQLASYLERLVEFATQNGVVIPKFNISRIRSSDYGLSELLFEIDLAEMELRKYVRGQSNLNF